MKLTCPQCGHTATVTCGCHSLPITHMTAGAIVCVACSAVNRLDYDRRADTWTVRVPDMTELDKLLARPDIMVGLEEIRRTREARA